MNFKMSACGTGVAPTVSVTSEDALSPHPVSAVPSRTETAAAAAK